MDERYPRLEMPTVDELRARGSEKWSYFPGTIGAFVAEMDFGLDEAIKGAMHRAVDAGLTGYAPRAAIQAMSEACAQWHRDSYDWQIEPQQVAPVADVIAALEMAVEQFATPGTPIIVPTPAYMPFLSVTKNLRRDVIEVPMSVTEGRYAMDLQALDGAFAAGGDLLILCNPHNPTGRVFSRAELAAVGRVVSRNGGKVFSDEIHAPLIYRVPLMFRTRRSPPRPPGTVLRRPRHQRPGTFRPANARNSSSPMTRSRRSGIDTAVWQVIVLVGWGFSLPPPRTPTAAHG